MLNHSVETFEMLHVDSTDDIDSGVQQFEHILIALFVAAKRSVCMSQFIDDRHLRMPFENCIEIHLFDRHPFVFNSGSRYYLQSLDQRCRVGTAVSLDKSEHDIDPALL